MAKYLSGMDAQEKEVKAEIKVPGFMDNDFTLKVSTGLFSSEDVSIKKNITYYEEVTSENEKKFSVGWGLVGLVIFGPLGGLAGAILGGDNEHRHIVAVQLNDGMKFAVQLDGDEYAKWVNIMPNKQVQGEEV